MIEFVATRRRRLAVLSLDSVAKAYMDCVAMQQRHDQATGDANN